MEPRDLKYDTFDMSKYHEYIPNETYAHHYDKSMYKNDKFSGKKLQYGTGAATGITFNKTGDINIEYIYAGDRQRFIKEHNTNSARTYKSSYNEYLSAERNSQSRHNMVAKAESIERSNQLNTDTTNPNNRNKSEIQKLKRRSKGQPRKNSVNNQNSRNYNVATTSKPIKVNLHNVDERAPWYNAKTDYTVKRENLKKPASPDKRAANLAKNHTTIGKNVTKTPKGQAAIDPVKHSTFKKNLDHYPKIKAARKGIVDFTKRNKNSVIAAIALGGAMIAISKLSSSYNNNNHFVKSTRITNMDNRSAYIPNSYKRGFDEIKSLTTDFGSKVHLNKTISKVMVTAKNSTRNSFRTTTGSITNKNIALKAHANAINHTRY